jgi:alkanesulfonate monooxygenase SsuD/methylene tetrahydromethanopterin reductase-like flavin-dependent oxidoreductase (luciferase family)
MQQIAQRGYCYFLSSRVHGGAIARARQEFAKILADAGSKYDPFRMGILMSAYVSETDEQAREESHEGVWYFLKNCLKGHLRNLNGRSLTSGPGIPNMEVSDYARLLENTKPGRAMLGDADDWDALQKAQSIIVGSPETVYRQISDLVRETQVGNLLIERAGFSVVREYVGHGIGTAMHEPPDVPNFGRRGRGRRVSAGDVFAVEPMVCAGSSVTEVLDDDWTVVTVDGSRAAHWEHTVAVTDDGPEILTLP